MSPELSAMIALLVLDVGFVALAFFLINRFARATARNGGSVKLRDFLEPLVLIVVAGVLALTTYFVLLRGRFWIAEIPFNLAVGWYSYLGRVLPQTDPDPWAVGTAAVCVVVFVLGTHVFFRWLFSARWRWKWTFSLAGLVVLMFAAGVAFTGMVQQTGWLIRSPEPLAKDNRLIR